MVENPSTGRNLELDIFIPSRNVGIEYDDIYWHRDIQRDLQKEELVEGNGITIIHIRKRGCPKLPEKLYCVERSDDFSDRALAESIKEVLQILGFPDDNIDISRDKKEITSFMRMRM